MERLFKVRYWDYSTQKCNLNGYVCLSSTLAWGVFSVLLVKVIHPPVAWLILRIPAVWSEPLVFVLVAGTTVDAVQSVRAALDLREILTKLTEENEDLRRLAKAGGGYLRLRRRRSAPLPGERTEIGRLLFSEQVEGERARIQEERGLHTLRREEQLDRLLSRRADARISALQTVSQTLQRALAELDERKELTGEALRARKQELTEALERLRDQEARVRTRTVRTYAQALRILQGNPSASAGRFSEALESLRNLAGSLKK
jgi:hypothetical protein